MVDYGFCGQMIDYYEIIECIVSALEEWLAMKRHPEIGAQILSKSKQLNELKHIVLCHHEHYDGKGYPCGLSGVPTKGLGISLPDAVRTNCVPCKGAGSVVFTPNFRKSSSFYRKMISLSLK
ncbi:HD-GYP domain-containing protein [Anaerosporobacter faecicola]|uniref:HD-GYP domain-containing protein n=1 Tax=Anaerosporobacter faecicola TaxID=2718714 RepID=UPI00143AC5E1|nr:HD domain-containing phosphohydrolase [Anaerosporobacter faecicola]